METKFNKKPNVLMLGWEFPPIINGGLGVACLGLAKSLSQHVNLSVILPKSDPNFMVDNVELIGLNNLDIESIKSIETSRFYEEFAKVETIGANVDPYHSSDAAFDILNSRMGETSYKRSTEKLNPFDIGDLYGEDVNKKVAQFSRYAAGIAAGKEFDLIYCHDWMTFLAGMEIKANTGKPLALHVHSLEFDRSGAESKGWVYQLEKEAMDFADVIIPVSNYTGNIAINHYHIDSTKIFPVHNGAEAVKVYNEPKNFPEKLVVFLGRVTGQKGPEFFLEIAERVIEETPNVRFVMAGTGDKLKTLIEKGAYKNIGSKFHFTGFLNKEKVHKLFAMADVYCMPSVSEPFGLSALEAAQFGIPCVISKQSGVAEVLTGALKADFWDVNMMSDHITALLTNDLLRDNVVEESFQDLESCSWDNAAVKIAGVCTRLLN